MTSETFTQFISTLTLREAASLWPLAVAALVFIAATTVFIRYSRKPAVRVRSLAARGATTPHIAQRLRMSQDVAALAAHRSRIPAPMKLLPARASAASYPAPPSLRRAPRMSLTA